MSDPIPIESNIGELRSLFRDLMERIGAAGPATSAHAFGLLREELDMANGALTPDEFAQLDNALSEAFMRANTVAVGEQKPQMEAVKHLAVQPPLASDGSQKQLAQSDVSPLQR